MVGINLPIGPQVANLAHVDKVFTPNPANVVIYGKLCAVILTLYEKT